MESTVSPQFVKYTFFKVAPEWRRLPGEVRLEGKRQFASVVEQFTNHLTIRSYSLMGMRGDADMLLWCVSSALEPIQELATQLARTGLGAYLDTPHSYLAMTRRSTYIDDHEHAGSESRTRVRPMNKPYLIVYPFVKTHAWYQLLMEERQRMMEEHFKVGHRYPGIKIHTSYSYGLDDQEFVLGFEVDDPGQFLELVMELRQAEQRPYTERDVPIFTCLLRPLGEVLESLGG
jgi:chlorite dismutase